MNDHKREAQLIRFLAAFGATAFVLHWPWEMLHMPGYLEMAGRSWSETAWTCTIATLGDVALTLGIYGIATLVFRQLGWRANGVQFYACLAILGAVSATLLELWALWSGRWAYTTSMPLLPVLDVGLSPFLQLTVLVPLSVWVARRWCCSSR